MRGTRPAEWLLGLVLVFLFAIMMGAIGIGGGASFYVGFVPGLLIGFWVLIEIQRELSRRFKELDAAAVQGLSSGQCLRCGRPLRAGVLDCPHCGFRFDQMG